MKLRPILIAAITSAFTFSLFTLNSQASDWTGVYARVDKVVFEPNANAPERIQIWGAFALATKNDRNYYEPAQKGYLYFSLKPGSEDICKKEWADIKAVAGSNQVIAFGGRSQPVRLRKAADKATDPDVHPVDHGIQKISSNRGDYGPIRDLLALPKE